MVNSIKPLTCGGKGKSMKFRKKPVVIDAEQWTKKNGSKVMKFTKELGTLRTITSLEPLQMIITTLEGKMQVDENDWIIKGIRGEFYPCKPDIFEATYEAVKD